MRLMILAVIGGLIAGLILTGCTPKQELDTNPVAPLVPPAPVVPPPPPPPPPSPVNDDEPETPIEEPSIANGPVDVEPGPVGSSSGGSSISDGPIAVN